MNIRDYKQKYYKNLPEDQKEKREYERNNYWNLSEDEKEKNWRI